ncbi:protein kinase [Acidobacteria bacterium AH-259-L09]|nr:protein kinase [Acidobacteria bacterium AH-259-L09]
MIGKTISHYKILEKIGQGGMGEVFLAEDTSLDRKVALKFLPEELQQDLIAHKRFLREAKSAAALDHPFICKIYEVGEAAGRDFIAMEYVPGETLKDKLAEGPLALKDVLQKATEIAEALEEAHEKGIVHRDLKPSNIMLTPKGHVKVMDFGLAKQLFPAGDVESQEQTVTASLTKTGATLGTLAYMSPEQLRGEEVDTRSDIFSFGIVLYEMLTRTDPFKKPEPMETASSILKEDPPPLSRYMDEVPAALQRTVKKMLVKETDRRFQHIDDVRIDLEEISEIAESSAAQAGVDSVAATTATMSTPVTARSWRQTAPWLLASLIVGAIITLIAVWNLSITPMRQSIKRYRISVPATKRLGGIGAGHFLSLSPDGEQLVYIARDPDESRRLYLHSMDGFEAKVLPGTESADHPFFSPDGRWVGFFAEGKLKKVLLEGGSPVIISEVGTTQRGATWAPDDTIIYGTVNEGLKGVSASGGKPVAATTLEKGEFAHRWPEILPGSEALLFTTFERDRLDSARIAVLSRKGGDRKVLLDEEGYSAHYVPTGHIVYVRAEVLMAVPFDLAQLNVIGSPVPILDGVQIRTRGAADYGFSSDGSLVYIPAGAQIRRGALVWVDRDGREVEQIVDEPLDYPRYPRLSPDGQQVALTTGPVNDGDLWVYDVRGRPPFPLALEGPNGRGVWTPDGKRVAFASSRASDRMNLFWTPADGSALNPEQLLKSTMDHYTSSWTPDGQELIFVQFNPNSGPELMALPIEGERKPRLVAQNTVTGGSATVSPDGRWLAYVSDVTGRPEIWVRPYPGLGAPTRISPSGGLEPLWRPNGREIFYLEGNKMMAVAVEIAPEFRFEPPQVLFEGSYVHTTRPSYDVGPDGRFLMIKPSEEQAEAAQIHVVLNWFEELKRLVPTDN